MIPVLLVPVRLGGVLLRLVVPLTVAVLAGVRTVGPDIGVLRTRIVRLGLSVLLRI